MPLFTAVVPADVVIALRVAQPYSKTANEMYFSLILYIS